MRGQLLNFKWSDERREKKEKNKEEVGDPRLHKQQHVSPHVEGYIFNVAINAII